MEVTEQNKCKLAEELEMNQPIVASEAKKKKDFCIDLQKGILANI